MNTTAASFTPLESLLLFQSILKHGVDHDAFARISSALQSNTFIRSDATYNADRLTSESLQQLFLHLLRDELTADDSSRHSLSNGNHPTSAGASSEAGSASPTTASKKRKIPSALPTLNDARVHAEQLPVLVERLYARYREHVVASIREDERRIEKIEGEIRVLEQQESESAVSKISQQKLEGVEGGRGQRQAGTGFAPTSAKPSEKTASAPNGEQQVAATQSKHAGPADRRRVDSNGSHSLPTAIPPSVRHTASASSMPEGPGPSIASPVGQRSVPSGVPLLPATTRPSAQPSTDASSTQSRPTVIPALQQLQHQIIPPSRTLPQPATLLSSSQPPSRAPTAAASVEPPVVPKTPGSGKLLATAPAGQLVGQPAGSSVPASRPLSPVHSTRQPPQQLQPSANQLLQQQPAQQSVLQATTKPVQVPSKTTQVLPGATPSQTPRTQTPRLNSPSITQPVTQIPQQLAGQPSAQVSQSTPAGPRIETPRPLVPATQKHTPIAPVPQVPTQFQRAPGTPTASALVPQAVAAAVPSTASTVPPRDNVLHGISTRPVLPEHVRGPPSRTPTPVHSPRPLLPHTPIQGIAAAGFIPRGSGTRWKPSEPTPSTPGPDVGDMASPAYEPLSPVQASTVSRADSADATDTSSVSPSTSAALLRQPRNLRKPQFSKPGQKADAASNRMRGRPSRHAKPQGEPEDDGFAIKAEESTPKAFDYVGEMGMEDNGDSNAASPGGPLSRALKRKRDESVDFSSPGKPDASVLARRRLVGPPAPPTHVLWMRGFPKISASALDQISSHRHANMFAHKIRDRDAPGYGSIVRHPVDLKSIRMAISQGNKAATAMAATLPESDLPGASSLWLPISEDLVPPRGIINSSQLECELVHMFANAIMYNPDSHRGPGPAFMINDMAEEDTGAGDSGTAGNARYKVDEDGVVNDTRDMYVEVEKLLSEMRSAERQRGMPAPPPGAKGLDLPLDDGELITAGEDEEDNGGDGGEDDAEVTGTAAGSATTDPEGEGSGAIKRRRITRGQ